jgi:hypothetical protein
MSDHLYVRASVLIGEEAAAGLERALAAGGLSFERAGVQRGISGAVELFIVATPSMVVLALLIEKLRRLRLPRTYVQLREHEVEIWTDTATSDGRILLIRPGGSVEELPDRLLTAETLAAALRESSEPE